ncbi:MAG: hypothetical protein A2808_03615 [Candidatus Moranbacteria bacterium RIFCSPHIGHO2_01_FULL_55_24]|nr:MAG: hypothetical protein A2808_03615 [Candidatus Moranbacteria bacterium RIFCSPHIGHO2_01_FULL_55_24]
MENTPLATLQQIAETLVEKLGFSGTISVREEENDPESFFIDISLHTDQNFLIGQHGMNLAALQHILRLLCRKALGERVSLVVDVNGYLAEKRGFLESEAEKAAQEAIETGLSVTLRPMQAFERKVVHTILAKNDRILTESVGKGEERKVLVRLKD